TSSIDHRSLLDVQRLVDVSVNLNSVQGSASMFANRAIELQAQGTYVLSNYSVGINSRYPHVHISNGFSDTLATLNSLSENHIRQVQAAGIRSVFSNDLAIMRIGKILQTVGLSGDVSIPSVAIVKESSDEHLSREIDRQTYQQIDHIVEASAAGSVEAVYESSDVVVHMGTGHEYAPTHVEDLVNAFRYTDAIAVEKLEEGVQGEGETQRHTYSDVVNVASLGAIFTGEVPEHIEPKPGYQIDEIGVKRRNESIELMSEPVGE